MYQPASGRARSTTSSGGATTPTPRIFQCHQSDAGHDSRRICAGWAGCHDSDSLLGLRLAVLQGRVDSATYQAVVDYTSPVPLFSSGGQAADHGLAGLDTPTDDARHMIDKISRTRQDLR
ncbi:DUF6283 family protein [Streptomyces erythrochromogenes]|uniref:DUF6283 family protein n=1 Tax=Streptomyces erythrochromogenes TaxID=285574 RepID=A0ABZ1QN85_9ACTN|nr:DUF6283 family protein [Streptomyces erythrochromogenes]